VIKMKVIIKKTAQVKDVSFGYAVNYLVPQGLAVIATPERLKKLKKKKSLKLRKKEEKVQVNKALVKKLAGRTVTIKAKAVKAKTAKKGDKIYKGIGEKEIVKALKVDPQQVKLKLSKPIKKLGDYKIDLKVGQQAATITVAVKKS